MTVNELYRKAPQCFVFIRDKDGRVTEYHGERLERCEIKTVLATSYPMFKHVLEVTLED